MFLSLFVFLWAVMPEINDLIIIIIIVRLKVDQLANLRRDFDRPNTFAFRFSLVQFGSLWSHARSKSRSVHFGSIWRL